MQWIESLLNHIWITECTLPPHRPTGSAKQSRFWCTSQLLVSEQACASSAKETMWKTEKWYTLGAHKWDLQNNSPYLHAGHWHSAVENYGIGILAFFWYFLDIFLLPAACKYRALVFRMWYQGTHKGIF